MKRLSRYRRHKAAGPLLLIFALLGIGMTFSVASATVTETENVFSRSASIEEGKQIFLKGCSSCHGLNAEGGAIAPSLIGTGAASVDFQVGTGRMPMADMSTQAMRNHGFTTKKKLQHLPHTLHPLPLALLFQQMPCSIMSAMETRPKAESYLEITAQCVTTLLVKVER